MNPVIGKSGQSIHRLEDDRLLKGKGRFIDNLNFKGQAYLHIVRSYSANAKINIKNTGEVKKMSGVLDVFTGNNLMQDGILPIPVTLPFKRPGGGPALSEPYHALSQGTVRFVGQPLAIVVAESREQALQAAECLEVEYEEYPAVTGLLEATEPEAPLLCSDLPDNIAASETLGNQQEVEEIFSNAHHVTRMELINNRLVGSPLEPRGLICDIDPDDGKLILHASHQSATRLQGFLCSIFKFQPEQLRVIVGDVGGGFGTKVAIYPEDVLVVYAAKKLNRPIKWTATRTEEFQASVHGRDHMNVAELACDPEGRIQALSVKTLANTGAYLINPALLIPLGLMSKVITSVYDIPTIYLETRCVLTNTAPIGAYRGAGRPEGIYPMERLIDMTAREMGIDPVIIRRRNLIRTENLPYTTPAGEIYESGNFKEVLEQTIKLMDWDGFEFRKAESEKRGLLRGRGLACYIEWTGGDLSETVRIEAESDGMVTLYSGTQNMGQGLETVFTQLLSEKLQIPMESIKIVFGDTKLVKGLGSFGSRSLFVGGTALLEGTKEFLQKGRELAAEELEAAEDDILYHNGRFQVTGTSIGVGLFDLASKQSQKCISTETEKTVEGRSWPNGCHIAEVEIDPETGRVFLASYGNVDDTGNMINPMIVEGQIKGGIAQGAGQVLLEQSVYDSEGQLLTASFMDYAMPRADDLPLFQSSTFTDAPCLTNPLGAKGVGEIGTVGSIPTIANAILDALWDQGVRKFDMPAYPQKIWKLIQDAKNLRQKLIC